ncbi:4-alpha-glucanotransferase [Streptococcus caprae]|uniref:4-alpha-glucanotransferase n=1 Tax=Streptococcus caprae TaxID=1640501 RepID=A0ABV8CSR0_9STRE
MKQRLSGILMPVTSLPGAYGIGTMGKAAYDFVDFLKETKQTYWQILPLTTTSYGDSPYQSFSAVAGNTNMIDLELLVAEGLLNLADIDGANFGDNPEFINYALLFDSRRQVLEKATRAFLADSANRARLSGFEEEQSSWLGDYAEFMAIKEHFGLVALQEWPDQRAIKRNPERLAELRVELADAIAYHKVVQYFFFSQWLALKTYANEQGIKIIGDMPIYVSADSVEVWTMPDLFKLDEDRKPLYIAGCPPDAFSDVGQLWGNPIYDWPKHAETGFAWWIYRIAESLKLCDLLRIDHFKGFSDYWEIPAGSETAKTGQWVSGPGIALFDAVKHALGDLPIIAENLGYIDAKAEQLLDDSGFPGMKILQFGLFDTRANSIDILHNFTVNSIAYTGTHDNDVVNGWYANLTEEQAAFADAYLHRHPDEKITHAMLRNLFSSVSNVAIACMQDILDKPANSRINLPNTVGGNWEWRMLEEDITDEHRDFLTKLTLLYDRAPEVLEENAQEEAEEA